MVDAKKTLRRETYQMALLFQRIGTRAALRAQAENRALGIPNSFTRDGKLYYELPDGTITQENPFEKR
jgi:hypothetical protein